MKVMKKSLAVLLVVLTLLSSLSVTSFAATKYKSYKGKYGLMVPVESDYKTKCSSYVIDSAKGTLTFSFKSKGHESNVYFGLTIYADEARQEILINKSGAFPKVNSKGSMTVDFSPLESGTYYGLTFTYIKKGKDLIIDKESIHQFDIKLNRVGDLKPKIIEAEALYAGNYLRWNTVEYADSYKLYRKQSGEDWKEIADVEDTEYTDKDVTRGQKYYYTVKARDEECLSKYNKKGVALIYLAAPEIVGDPECFEDNNIKISWNAVDGATKYRVYRKADGAKKYTRLATVTDGITEFIDKSEKVDGTTYHYAVKAATGTLSGALSEKATVTLFGMQKPIVSCIGETVTITWNAVEGATEYQLMKKAEDGQWDVLYTGTEVFEYVDKDVSEGRSYNYSLLVKKDGEASSLDTKGVTANCLAEPKITSIKADVANSVLVKWNKIEGATGYNVYRTSPFEEGKFVGYTTKTSLYDTVAKDSNYFYSYYVEAVNDTSASLSGRNIELFLYMEAPDLVSLKWNNGNVIKWNRVAGATSYKVYRRTPSGSFKEIAEVKGSLTYKDTSAKKNSKYYYTVAAMNGKTEGCYEIALGVNCLNAPEVTSVSLNKSKQVVVKWNSVSGAKGYYVYRKETVDGSWESIGKTTKLTYTDKSKRKADTEYYYTVRAYNDKGKGVYNKFGKLA